MLGHPPLTELGFGSVEEIGFGHEPTVCPSLRGRQHQLLTGSIPVTTNAVEGSSGVTSRPAL